MLGLVLNPLILGTQFLRTTHWASVLLYPNVAINLMFVMLEVYLE